MIFLVPFGAWSQSPIVPQTRDMYDPGNDFIELKNREDLRNSHPVRGQGISSYEARTMTRREARHGDTRESLDLLRDQTEEANVFSTEDVPRFRVLKDDRVVEIQNPRTGKRVITIIKASALPEEDLNQSELQYTLMELDHIAIQVEKHDDEPRSVQVGSDGMISYPLIGDIYVKGMTLAEVEQVVEDRFEPYVREPIAHAEITRKSPQARILVVGKGYREYMGYEKVLDIVGADWEPTSENIYDRYCVIRKYEDNSLKCIVVDVEHMFKYFDFTQNIPLQAGDVILIKKMPPLFGYRFKFWWQQVLSWLNEVDSAANAIRSIKDFEL